MVATVGSGMRWTTVAAPRLAPNVSLLSSAEIIPNEPSPSDANGHHWMNGIRYRREPFGVGNAGPMGYRLATHVQTTQDKTGTDVDRTEVDCDPFLVWVEEPQSTLGFPASDFVGRATRQLARVEAYQVEYEFWTGTQIQAAIADGVNDAADQWLAQQVSSTTLLGGAATATGYALGLLQKAMADVNGGEPGMIHIPTIGLAPLLSLMLVTPVNPNGKPVTKYIDDYGNTVVPGLGYPNTAPNGSSPAAGLFWMYGTGPVRIRRDEVQVVPDNYGQALDKLTNDIDFRAERAYLCDWDRSTHIAVLSDPTGIAGY